jgi:hypothetical protein
MVSGEGYTMIGRVFGCSLVLCLLIVPAARGQTHVVWKFTRGQIFECERRTTQKQTVGVKDKEFKQERQSTWHIRMEVEEADAKGCRIRAVLSKVEQQLAGAAVHELIDPKLAEKMQGSVFTLHVTPQGRLLEFKGYEDFLKKLGGDDKARFKALRITFAEDTLREAFTDLFGPLPEKKVARGDAWERTYVEPIPHFGALRSTVRYVHEGTTLGNDLIAYSLQTVYELPKDDMMVLFRIVKGKIDSEKAKGVFLFDTEAGRLVEHERTMFLRGTLTIVSMDRQETLEFTSTSELKINIKATK